MYTHLQHPAAPPASSLEVSRRAARQFALTEHLRPPRHPRRQRFDAARLRLARWIAPGTELDLGPAPQLRA